MKTLKLPKARSSQILHFQSTIQDEIGPDIKSKFLYVRNSDAIYCLLRSEITFIKASGNYSEIYSTEMGKIISSKTLKFYQDILAKSYFLRAHQSYLINTEQISQLIMKNGAKICMRDGSVLPVSRSRQASIISFLQN